MKRTWVVVVLVLAMGIGLFAGSAGAFRKAPGTIVGLISLPDGEYAPEGGIIVRLTNDLGDWAKVKIGKGANGALYSLKGVVGQSQTVRYLIEPQGYPGNEYLRQGFYAADGTTAVKWDATSIVVPAEGVARIDLEIKRGTTISGTVRLPDGYVAPKGGTDVQIGNDAGSWVNVKIPEGKSSADYELVVGAGEYTISYVSFSDNRFIREVFYGVAGAAVSHAAATKVTVNGPVTGVDVTLIPVDAPGEKLGMVAGTVYLPEGQVAPAKGLGFLVMCDNGPQVLVVIPEGKNSVEYVLPIPVGEGYRIRYLIQTHHYAGNEYIRQGYYNTLGTYPSQDKALGLTVTKEGLTGIDLYILRGHMISGTISLPTGHVAGPNGVWVQVGTSGGWANVLIPAGKSSVEYGLSVQPGNYYLVFDPFQGGDYVRGVYYSSLGATTTVTTATAVDARHGDIGGINITLLALK